MGKWTKVSFEGYVPHNEGYVDSGWRREIIYVTSEVTHENLDKVVFGYIMQTQGVSKFINAKIEGFVEPIPDGWDCWQFNVCDVRGHFVEPDPVQRERMRILDEECRKSSEEFFRNYKKRE